MTLQFNMTLLSKNRHESEQEGLERLITKALRTPPKSYTLLCHNPHIFCFLPFTYVCFSQQTVSQIPSWSTSFLVSAGN